MFTEDRKNYLTTLRKSRGGYDKQTNVGIEKLIIITKRLIKED